MIKVIISKIILFSIIIMLSINIIKENIVIEEEYKNKVIVEMNQLGFSERENFNESYNVIMVRNNNELFINYKVDTLDNVVYKGVYTNTHDIVKIYNILYNNKDITEWLTKNINELIEENKKYNRDRKQELIEKDKKYIIRLQNEENGTVEIYVSIIDTNY